MPSIISKNMNDNYSHNNCQVIYICESIPGPFVCDAEYKEIDNNFNSQIADHCNCNILCEPEKCLCLLKSGGANYSIEPKQNQLQLKDLLKVYPLYECNDLCECSQTCGNRYVQKGPIKGLYIKKCDTEPKGLGLYTNTLIPQGTFICEYAGEIITKSQAVMRHSSNQAECKMNYIFCLQEFSNGRVTKTFVDPIYFGNIGRYINHSCNPNSAIIPVRVNNPIPKLAIFSNCEILPDTEITFSYGSQHDSPSAVLSKTKCLCNSHNCTGWLPFDVI